MKIKIHYTYVFIALSFMLCGYFANLLVFTSIILMHDMGHIIMAKLMRIKIGKIVIYPYGGVLELDVKINTPVVKELIVAMGGFLSQTVFYIGIVCCFEMGIIREYIFELFTNYYKSILWFNMLPIYPLDGAKIVRLLLDYWLPYRVVNKLIIVISIVVGMLVVCFNMYQFNYTFFMIGMVIIDNLRRYYQNLDYYFNLFLLERYLYKHNFKKRKIVRSVRGMQKDKYHFFSNNGGYETEKQILERKFGRNREKMFDYNERL